MTYKLTINGKIIGEHLTIDAVACAIADTVKAGGKMEIKMERDGEDGKQT